MSFFKLGSFDSSVIVNYLGIQSRIISPLGVTAPSLIVTSRLRLFFNTWGWFTDVGGPSCGLFNKHQGGLLSTSLHASKEDEIAMCLLLGIIIKKLNRQTTWKNSVWKVQYDSDILKEIRITFLFKSLKAFSFMLVLCIVNWEQEEYSQCKNHTQFFCAL